MGSRLQEGKSLTLEDMSEEVLARVEDPLSIDRVGKLGYLNTRASVSAGLSNLADLSEMSQLGRSMPNVPSSGSLGGLADALPVLDEEAISGAFPMEFTAYQLIELIVWLPIILLCPPSMSLGA